MAVFIIAREAALAFGPTIALGLGGSGRGTQQEERERGESDCADAAAPGLITRRHLIAAPRNAQFACGGRPQCMKGQSDCRNALQNHDASIQPLRSAFGDVLGCERKFQVLK